MDDTAEEEGVRAFARGLEHINISWALAGSLLRLPGVSHTVQVLMDGSGFQLKLLPAMNAAFPV
jgi:hypothetical protein